MDHGTVTRTPDEGLTPYAMRLARTIIHLASKARPDVSALEDLRVPNSHVGRGTAQVRAFGDTSRVIGHLEATGIPWRMVAPGRNGSCPRRMDPKDWASTYPDELWSPREDPRNGGKATGVLRHARSAWDVAKKALQ